MRMRRLGWAGLEITSGETTIAVDLFEDIGPLRPFVGDAHEPLPPPSRPLSGALVTHLHSDHADPAALARALASDAPPVLRPAASSASGLEAAGTLAAEAGFEEHGVATEALESWERRTIGPFAVTAVPAVDGFGDPQVSWVVEADGQRVLHAGDTVFHGAWWSIAARLGPIDIAFLPVNGPVCDLPHRQPPSPLPVAMDPRQAAAAAHLLQARAAVPIHYGAIHRPPAYAQVDDPAGRFEQEGARLGVRVQVVGVGDEVAWPAAVAG
jgi:L-ascorbate metabolism protein UlaG (beta-lactamase superfamily)